MIKNNDLKKHLLHILPVEQQKYFIKICLICLTTLFTKFFLIRYNNYFICEIHFNVIFIYHPEIKVRLQILNFKKNLDISLLLRL